VLFVIPMKIGLQKLRGSKLPFLERKFRLYRLRTVAARKREGILEKRKLIGKTTISSLPSHPRLVKFGWGHLSYRGLTSCAFWSMASWAIGQHAQLMSRRTNPRNVMDWLYLVLYDVGPK